MAGKRVVTIAMALLCGVFAASAALETVDLSSKAAIKKASSSDLAASVKAQVLAARKAATDEKAANLATEGMVKNVFSKLGTSNADKARAQAVLAALYSIPGVDFVRLVKVAAEAQPLLARVLARAARLLDPDHASDILTALASSAILNKTLGTGPGSSSVSANVAALSGSVVSDEQ
jgi:hypothetical protein